MSGEAIFETSTFAAGCTSCSCAIRSSSMIVIPAFGSADSASGVVGAEDCWSRSSLGAGLGAVESFPSSAELSGLFILGVRG